ncbi:MAG: hypothetical protein K9M17_05775 [Mariprofundaceae bacterium]|nr:hypothetical protein [Mariprofundaceae bacterium]
MDFGLLTILLVVGTVIMYLWFFRTSDDNFDEQRKLPFDNDEADEKNPERRNNHE